jgi:hypothetical protein
VLTLTRNNATIRGQAIGMLARAGQRAERTGAPASPAASYATAAALAAEQTGQPVAEVDGGAAGLGTAGWLWELAAWAAYVSADIL